MRLTSLSLFSSILACSILSACTEMPDETGLIINNVTVVDAVSPIRAERSVVIRDDKIFAVNPALEGRAANTSNVIDGSGQFLIPG